LSKRLENKMVLEYCEKAQGMVNIDLINGMTGMKCEKGIYEGVPVYCKATGKFVCPLGKRLETRLAQIKNMQG
jgi:hypothetical protein